MRTRINFEEPISISDIHKNNLTNLEMETMSQDLADKFIIEILGNFNVNGAEPYLNLIPKKKMLNISDVLYFENDYNWCAFHDYKYCSIKTNQIPKNLDSFNVILNCFDYRNIVDFKTIFSDDFGIIMSFISFMIQKTKVLHLGVLAKTDNDTWKFYPRFHSYQEDLNTLLKDKNSFLH